MAKYRRKEQKLYYTRRWKTLRKKVKQRAGNRCQECGKVGALDCDHIIPVDEGGDFWDIDNLQALCRMCHIEKTRKQATRRRAKNNPVIIVNEPTTRRWTAFVNELK